MADTPTQAIARFVSEARVLPDAVKGHASRTFLNFLGCAVGGSHHEAVELASRALLPLSGREAATVIGRGERADLPLAALLNGMSASVYSFDDTHAEAVVHPGGAVGCALLALAESRTVNGRDFLLAYALGVEVVCRLSKAISVPPAVAEPGWVQTGITAGIGAAAAVAKVLGLDARRMAWSLGTAVCQSGGPRSVSRSMCFSLMAGQAAQAGLRAALLAEQGFTSADNVLEAPSGFLQMYSSQAHAAFVVEGLGRDFELLRNTFKPYPCGVVLHPAIDACLELVGQGAVPVEHIERIAVRLNPAAVALGNIAEPRTVQEGQVSVQHWVAATLVDRAAGLAQGRKEKLADSRIAAVRSRVRLVEDAALARDAAQVDVTMAGGGARSSRIDHCRGSAARPMLEEDLAIKFRGQCADVIGDADTDRLLHLCARLESLEDVSVITRAGAGRARN